MEPREINGMLQSLPSPYKGKIMGELDALWEEIHRLQSAMRDLIPVLNDDQSQMAIALIRATLDTTRASDSTAQVASGLEPDGWNDLPPSEKLSHPLMENIHFYKRRIDEEMAASNRLIKALRLIVEQVENDAGQTPLLSLEAIQMVAQDALDGIE